MTDTQALIERLEALAEKKIGFRRCEPNDLLLIRRNALPEIIAALREREGEAKLREWRANDPDVQPDGTAETLATCATMLETYGPDCFPANEHGQVHFARAMMDSVAAEIRAFLANTTPPTGSAAAHAEAR